MGGAFSSVMHPGPGDALVVVDMQRDFLPGGALAVAGGDAIIAGVEALAARFEHVVLTADAHPRGHISFATSHAGKQPFDIVQAAYGPQTLWPEHCVQGTAGAEIAVNVPHAELLLRKGFRREIDSYSAFVENDGTTPTGLAGYLRERGLQRLFFCGLAYDFCVGASALDGAAAGFTCAVVEDLTRGVAVPATAGEPGSMERMTARLRAAGVTLLQAAEIAAR